MDQGVRYIVRLDDINVATGLRNMESSAVKTEASIASLNNSLISIAGAFGIGFGINALVSFGKDAIQGASDYEIAVMRIKNVSKTAAEGLTNVAFINAEADKLKIPLQEAADAYGNFLVKIANSGLAGDQVRKLHDEILSIAKVTGAPQGKMDSAVLDIGKMLAEGVLEARTLRQLERVFPQITPFIAQKMGLKQGKDAFAKVIGAATDESAATALQKLSRLESSGKLTKLGIDSKVLLSAIDAYYDSIKGKIPGTLDTIQSNINELGNDWLRFKNDLVLNNKNDLIDFLHELEGGIKQLVLHEKDIVSFGKALITIGEIWAGYKVGVALVNIALGTYNGFMSGFIGKTASELSATEARTVAMNGLAASMERVAFASEAMAKGQLGYGFTPLAASGKTGLAGEGAAVGGAELTAAGIASAVSGVLLTIAFGAAAIEVLNTLGTKWGWFGDKAGGKKTLWDTVGTSDWNDTAEGLSHLMRQYNEQDKTDEQLRKLYPDEPSLENYLKARKDYGGDDYIKYDKEGAAVPTDMILRHIDAATALNNMLDPGGMISNYGKIPIVKIDKNASDGKINIGTGAPKDHVTGQHVVTYNIHIPKIIGQEIGTQQVIGDKGDTENVAMKLRDIIISIVNDSQIRGAA